MPKIIAVELPIGLNVSSALRLGTILVPPNSVNAVYDRCGGIVATVFESISGRNDELAKQYFGAGCGGVITATVIRVGGGMSPSRPLSGMCTREDRNKVGGVKREVCSYWELNKRSIYVRWSPFQPLWPLDRTMQSKRRRVYRSLLCLPVV
jgi:hypothetical protein